MLDKTEPRAMSQNTVKVFQVRREEALIKTVEMKKCVRYERSRR